MSLVLYPCSKPVLSIPCETMKMVSIKEIGGHHARRQDAERTVPLKFDALVLLLQLQRISEAGGTTAL